VSFRVLGTRQPHEGHIWSIGLGLALRGTAALDSGRVVASTLGWFAELDDLLVRDHSALPEVQDFHERYTTVRRSVSQRPGRR
jgi:hypothetical protein